MINSKKINKFDFHIHSTYSDGTDSIEELLNNIKEAKIDMFSLTDHDCVTGCEQMQRILKNGEPAFINGVEFSCRDATGKYHILGYNYDLKKPSVRHLAETCHNLRIEKVKNRIEFLKTNYGFYFDEQETKELFSLNNPGKPHIAKLLIKHGYAKTISDGIENFIANYHGNERKITPEEAISAILAADGIPILAHGLFGDGGQLVSNEAMITRLKHLLTFGIRGMECYYSGFSPKQEEFLVNLCYKNDLLITAGSDYHGKNKMIQLGDVTFYEKPKMKFYLDRFIKEVL